MATTVVGRPLSCHSVTACITRIVASRACSGGPPLPPPGVLLMTCLSRDTLAAPWQGPSSLSAHRKWSSLSCRLSAKAQQLSVSAGVLPRIVQIHVWRCGCWVEFDPRGSSSQQRDGGVQPSPAQQGHTQPQTSEVAEPAAVQCPAAAPTSSTSDLLPVLHPLVWFKFFTEAEADVSLLAASAHQPAGVHQILSA